jgi:hypothetical protein
MSRAVKRGEGAMHLESLALGAVCSQSNVARLHPMGLVDP